MHLDIAAVARGARGAQLNQSHTCRTQRWAGALTEALVQALMFAHGGHGILELATSPAPPHLESPRRCSGTAT